MAQLKPHLVKYPQQAAALFQSFLDLSLAQAWKDVEILELEGCQCIVLKGRAKGRSEPSFVLPMSLTQPTTLAQFSAIFTALARLDPAFSPSSSAAPPSTSAPSSAAEASSSPSPSSSTPLPTIPSATPPSTSSSSTLPSSAEGNKGAEGAEGQVVTQPGEGYGSTLYLAIVEKDSSVVYYVLKRGIWSPKEVPE